MRAWQSGRSPIEYLLGSGRLERVVAEGSEQASERIVTRSRRRLETAKAAASLGDLEGAFVAAYDAYRMAGESLLYLQVLRATGGEGSHVTVEDAVSAQFASEIQAFDKAVVERFRRMRHAAQYFDPSPSEITEDDSRWAITTATRALDDLVRLNQADPPTVYEAP